MEAAETKTKQKMVHCIRSLLFRGRRCAEFCMERYFESVPYSGLFFHAAQESLLAALAAVQLAGLGVLVPVAEELIFRGLIYERMKRFFSVKVSVLLSSLLFALYHGNPIQMIFAFPMAVVLAVVMQQGKSILFPILFHMGANLAAVCANLFV